MLLLILLTSLSPDHKSDTLYWCHEKKLSWEIFTYDSAATRIGARIAPQLWVTPRAVGKNFVLEVHAVLFKGKALSNDTSKSLLEHEQIHFDIAELAARKARAYVSKQTIVPGNVNEMILSAYDLGVSFMKETNEQFDNETHHGFLESPQNQWRKRIDDELERSEAFKVSCR